MCYYKGLTKNGLRGKKRRSLCESPLILLIDKNTIRSETGVLIAAGQYNRGTGSKRKRDGRK